MNELNPNHPVTKELHNQWHKLAAIILHKLGMQTIDISIADIAAFENSYQNNGGGAIVAEPKDDVIHITLVSMNEAEQLAQKEQNFKIFDGQNRRINL